MIYPKKKPKAGFGLDLSQLKLKEGFQNAATNNPQALASGLGEVGELSGALIKKFGTSDLGYGVSHTSGAANISGGALSGAAKGASALAALGPAGMAVGAIGGGAIGLATGAVDALTNTKEDAFRKRDSLEGQAITDQNNKGVSVYNELEQKQVMEDGGEVPDGEDGEGNTEAVILGGKRHKDGGNDIVDETGQKVAETEREEIVFTKDQTQMIERAIKLIDEGKEDEYLNLGSYIKEIILNRTQDASGKFNQLNDADLQK